MNYNIGLDIGIASIGWSVIDLDNNRIEDLGVRIFQKAEHPKNGEPLALPRRAARGTRRVLRRKAYRLRRLVKLLIDSNFVADKEEFDNNFKINKNQKDIWELRYDALQRKLTNLELVRVLIHISKRRGFKSNRKSETTDSDSGKLLTGIDSNQKILVEKNYRTIGEMFYKDEKFKEHKRNKSGDYSNTVSRSMLEAELKIIFESQKAFGNNLITEEFSAKFLEIFNSQRPYATKGDIEKLIGKCTFEKSEPRAVSMSYTAERFTLLQTINNLRLVVDDEDINLTAAQREKLIEMAYTTSAIKYKQIRKTLKLSDGEYFKGLNYNNKDNKNPEESVFIQLKGFHKLKSKITKHCEPGAWEDLIMSTDNLDTIAYALTVYKDDNDIIEHLESNLIDNQIIEAVLDINFSKVKHLSLVAMKKLIPYLEQGHKYNVACDSVGYNFNQPHKSETNKLLPNIPADEVKNPVVLRALTQSRKVLNAIILRYGSPVQINIEVARDLSKPFKERKKIERLQKANKDEKDKAKAQLEDTFAIDEAKSEDILKHRLWNQQNGFCPYSQTQIDINKLFDIGYVQIDHIIPFSRCFDDSLSNKILVKTYENQIKGNKTPYEYFGANTDRWDSYETWVKSTPTLTFKKKANLLKTQYDNKASRDFKERHLNDTKYISKFLSNFIRNNLEFAPSEHKQKVITVNGQVTAFLRARWGLSKSRTESNLHHALDACVVAVTTQGMIQKISTYSRLRELYNIKKNDEYVDPETGEIVDGVYQDINLKQIPLPWTEFKDELNIRLSGELEKLSTFENYKTKDLSKLKPIFVSFAPNRKMTGAAHKETIRSAKYLDENVSVIKTPLTEITLEKLENMVDINNNKKMYEVIKERLIQYNNEPKKAFLEPLYKPTNNKDSIKNQIKSIKIETIQKSGIKINNGVAGNGSLVRVDLFLKNKEYYIIPIYVSDTVKEQLPNKVVTPSAKNEDAWTVADDTFKFCFSLHTNDLVKIVTKKETIIAYYKSFNRSSGVITLQTHDTSNNIEVSFKKSLNIEKFQIDVLGNYYFKVKKENRRGFGKPD